MADALRILITDEDPDSRVNTRKAAERAQLGIAGEVGYGTAAVSFALNARPDIILVAVEEPVSRPLETAEALANALPETPIIIYSSINETEAVRRAMVFGARDYIVKPVQSIRLRESVQTVLAQEERRHLRRSGQLVSGGRGTVITVTGAKGGIGKTVVSVNLSIALRRETGRSVVILDADTHFGDVATMLDLSPDRSIEDLLAAIGRLDRQSVYEFLTEHPTGVEVLAAPSSNEVWARFDNETLKRIIDTLAQTFDFVVIDTEGSFDAHVRACIEASTLTLVITTGEVSSIRDTATAMRRLESWEIEPERVKVLLNRGARVDSYRVEDLQTAINREIFWQIPHDRKIPASVQVGQPVLLGTKSKAADNFTALARLIAGTKKPLVPQAENLPLWKRVFRRGAEHDAVVASDPSVPIRER